MDLHLTSMSGANIYDNQILRCFIQTVPHQNDANVASPNLTLIHWTIVLILRVNLYS